MIILDTNIISELMKPEPNSSVSSWIDQQIITKVFLTAITIAEINYGIQVLPGGKRQQELEQSFEKTIMSIFQYRILSFDKEAAYCYGKIMIERKKKGRPLSIPDAQIAAISLIHNARLATRNIPDFVECGIELINPFC